MDPVGVEGDSNKWGVITRLLHLDDVVGWKNPFELYKKAEIKHFNLETGEVALNAKMPAGIGIEYVKSEKAKKTGRGDDDGRILIDPMTKEIISKAVELDENGRKKVDGAGKIVYKGNDHWFKLDVKFIWKDAPKETTETEQTEETTETEQTEETTETKGE
jgi:hypothetical protein